MGEGLSPILSKEFNSRKRKYQGNTERANVSPMPDWRKERKLAITDFMTVEFGRTNGYGSVCK